MTPRNGESGRVTTPTAAANQIETARPQIHKDATALAGVPTVLAVLFLAAGAAAYNWAVVRACPFCGYAHRHTWFERNAQVIERAPSCKPHATYQVRISDVVPAANSRRGVA